MSLFAKIVPLRRKTSGNAVAPAATGATKAVPTTRHDALEAIFDGLLRADWTVQDARRIVQVADEGMAAVVAEAAAHVIAKRGA